MQILCNFWFRTKITKSLLMEGDQYHNPYSNTVVANDGQPNPSNEDSSKATYNESDDEPKLPYTHLYLWLK